MKRLKFYAGAGALAVAAVLAVLDMTRLEASSGGAFLSEVRVYPAAFFALLGVLLIFQALKSRSENRS